MYSITLATADVRHETALLIRYRLLQAVYELLGSSSPNHSPHRIRNSFWMVGTVRHISVNAQFQTLSLHVILT